MSPTRLLVPTFLQMLKGLSGWLDKAVAQEAAAGCDAEALLSLRLADDMYPLAAQIIFACVQAQEPVHRLRGDALPEALTAMKQAGWHAGEAPGTLADARARIGDAIAFLEALASDALDEGAARAIALDLPNGIIFDMSGADYARDWALPQFYFHLNTAYAILRHHGVALGKADYVGYMLAYLRPGTMPGA